MIFKSINIPVMKDTINSADIGPATKGRMKSLFNLMYAYACESNIVLINHARNFSMKGLLKEIEANREEKSYSLRKMKISFGTIIITDLQKWFLSEFIPGGGLRNWHS